MSHSARWFLGAVLAGCGAISAHAQTPGAPSPARSLVVADTNFVVNSAHDDVTLPERDRKDVPWRSFSDVTKGARVQTGLFTLYTKRENNYLSLAPTQLDRDYLLVTQLSQGIGELGLDGGSSVRSDLIRFHRAGDRIELWVVNPHFAARPGTPMARAVAYSFGHSVAQSFAIATMRDNGEILLDLSPFLLSDWADLSSFFQGVANQRKLTGSIYLDRDRSSLEHLQLFPGNLEAEVRLTYQSNRNLGIEALADYRWIPVGVHYSLLELPSTPMRPRYADERVGYFVSAIKDFSRDTAESFFVRFVNRWRLEKRNPNAALSEPVQPIVYYIDRTVPTEWRPWVRAGILEWNRAFEEAGIRNAIRVLDAPDDTLWSAEDARYSTVRWTATNRSVYAVGPTNVDPRTGEILNADVLVSAAWIQTWRGESGEYVAPEAAIRSVFVEDSAASGPNGESRLCSLGEGLRREGTLTRAVLAGRDETGRPALYRPGAEGVDHARGGTHAGPSPQLPWICRSDPDSTLRSLVHPVPWRGCVGDGLQPCRALLGSAQAGRLLRAYHRLLRPLGDPLWLHRAGRSSLGAGGEGIRGHRSGLGARGGAAGSALDCGRSGRPCSPVWH